MNLKTVKSVFELAGLEVINVTIRVVRNEDYVTLKLKTAKVYLEINP